ncbi:MAG TPA: TRAP transporter small permease [Rhodospirillales bacterium]|jgi:TRAP-type C4-dicarboxylate transport system permease small subunit|nr:TRAP transporter small permease [Rhodospirillales bacterium]
MAEEAGRFNWLDTVVDFAFNRVFLAISAFALVFALAIVALQVFARYVLGDSLIWAEEVARYALIWSALTGAAVAYRHGSHIGVTLLTDMLPLAPATAVFRIAHLVCLAFAGVMTWEGWFLTLRVFARGEISGGLPLQLGWIYLAVPVGGAFIMIAAFEGLLRGVHCADAQSDPFGGGSLDAGPET